MSPGRSPEAIRAHRAVHGGHFRRQRPSRCETCPNNTDLQAHHDDYAKPLEVRWLCRSCHIKHHVALRKAEGTYKPGGRRKAAPKQAKAKRARAS